MKRNTVKFSVLFLVLLVSGFMVGTVLAGDYLGTGKFPTNQITWCHTGSYAGDNQNAIAKWTAVTDLDIYTGCGTSNFVRTKAANYGANGSAGYAWICYTDGTCDIDDNKTFKSCEAQSNTYYLSTWTSTQRQFNATHETGHCWSLGHRTDTGSVMNMGQLNTIEPNTKDKQLVNDRY